MTAFALKKPVLATSVGAFPEYLNEHENGLLVLPDIISLANGINTMLKNDYCHDLEMKMKKVNVSSKQKQNLELFSKLYA
jgi:glycosyltransferase involved in cell wall biosynthesis